MINLKSIQKNKYGLYKKLNIWQKIKLFIWLKY